MNELLSHNKTTTGKTSVALVFIYSLFIKSYFIWIFSYVFIMLCNRLVNLICIECVFLIWSTVCKK